jgi:DNA-directed RNA polymerase subunit RPC12/RpoP
MFKKYYCTNCKSYFTKTVSDKFVKSVRLECPNCQSRNVIESSAMKKYTINKGNITTIVNKSNE